MNKYTRRGIVQFVLVVLFVLWQVQAVRADVNIAELVRLGRAGQLAGGSQVTASGTVANPGTVSAFVQYEIGPMVQPYADPARGWGYTQPSTGAYFSNYQYGAPAAPQPTGEVRTTVPSAPPQSNFVVTWAAWSGHAFRQFMASAANSATSFWVFPGAARTWNNYYGCQYGGSCVP